MSQLPIAGDNDRNYCTQTILHGTTISIVLILIHILNNKVQWDNNPASTLQHWIYKWFNIISTRCIEVITCHQMLSGFKIMLGGHLVLNTLFMSKQYYDDAHM